MAANAKKAKLEEGIKKMKLRSGKEVYYFNTTKRGRGYVKHAILRRYVQAWFPKLGYHYYDEIVYVDGFAGTGKHVLENGGVDEPGSPLVAYEAIKSHSHLLKVRAKIIMIFIEKDAGQAKELRQNLAIASEGVDPERISWKVMTGKFNEQMPLILSEYPKVPMLVFADPFGYTQTPMELLQEIMNSSGPIDLIVNVMNGFALRVGMDIRQAEAMAKLIGVTPKDWIGIWREKLSKEGLTPWQRREIFMDIYKKNLSSGQKLHFLQFGMRREKTNTHVYHLLFASRHPDGKDAMKHAMWNESQKVDELVFSEFDKKKGKMINLPEKKAELIPLVFSKVMEEFKGKNFITGQDICDFLLETLFKVYKNDLKDGLKKFKTSKGNKEKFENMIYDFTLTN